MRKAQFLSFISGGGGGGGVIAGRQGRYSGTSSALVSAGQGRASPLRASSSAVMWAYLPWLISRPRSAGRWPCGQRSGDRDGAVRWSEAAGQCPNGARVPHRWAAPRSREEAISLPHQAKAAN